MSESDVDMDTIESLEAFVEELDQEAAVIDQACAQITTAADTAPAVVTLAKMLQDSFLPALTGLASRTLAAVSEVAANVEPAGGIEPADAEVLSKAILLAAGFVAKIEAESTTDERKRECAEVGQALTNALQLVKELTLVEVDDEESEDE